VVQVSSCNLAAFSFYFWNLFKKQTAHIQVHDMQLGDVPKKENHMHTKTNKPKTLHKTLKL